MKFAFIAFIALFSSGVFAETVCAPSIPKNLDPHQVIFPLEQDLASKLYLPLISTVDGQTSVAKSWDSKDGITWKIVLNSKVKFSDYKNWRAPKAISAEDVVFSIQRQLKRNARSLYEEVTFHPAKRVNLDYKLKEIKIVSPTSLTFTFWQSIPKKEFEQMMASPVGYVVSSDYAKTEKNPAFFPASGEYNFLENKTGQLMISTRSKDGKILNIGYKEIAADADVASIKLADCDQLYYPRPALLQEFKTSKSRFFPEKISGTKLFLIINPDVTIPPQATMDLRKVLSPLKYSELKGYHLTSGLFTDKKSETSNKTFNLPPRKLEFYYCDVPTLSGVDMEKLVEQITAEVDKAYNLLLIPNRTSCELIQSMINNPMVGATLSSFTYKTEEDVANQFTCSYVRSSIGFCLPNLKISDSLDQKKKNIQPEYDKNTFVIPLLDEENFVVQF